MGKTIDNSSLIRAPIAVVLAWLIPGLGHLFLGHRVRGVIFLTFITLTFWTGVAIGGVKCVAPYRPTPQSASQAHQPPPPRSWWFFAQILNGGYAMASFAAGNLASEVGYLSWPSGDIASVYTGVAGLLNLLIIIDALARAEGLPLRRRSASRTAQPTGPPRRGG